MGSGHSSARFGGASEFCATRSGVAEFVARPGTLRRAAALFLLVAIRVYQVVLTPLMPSACKFYPSCSRYASEAIAKHGACRGLGLAARRLLRCRPFAPGGYDPVPDPEDESMAEERL